MSTAPKLPTDKMTVAEFLASSENTPGRFELFHGLVYEMQAERAPCPNEVSSPQGRGGGTRRLDPDAHRCWGTIRLSPPGMDFVVDGLVES